MVVRRQYRITDLPSVGFSGDYYHRPAFIHGEWPELDGCVMFVDLPGKGSDETAYAIVGQLNGNLYVLKWVRMRGYRRVLEGLAKAAKRRNVNRSPRGPVQQGMLQPPAAFSAGAPSIRLTVRSNVQKERRIINALEPVMNQHRLVINRSVIEQDSRGRDDESVETSLAYQLFHQLTHITVEPKCLQHDDRLDALAGAIQYWNESLAIDEDRAIKERQAELWDLELEAYMGNLEGALDAKVLGIPLDQLGRSDAKSGSNLQVDKPRAYVVPLPIPSLVNGAR